MPLGLLVGACADQHAPPVAMVQSQHMSSTCARDSCRLPKLAALSSDVRTGSVTSVPDKFPVIEVEQVCQGIAEQGGVTFHDPEIAHTKKDCLDSEHAIRDELMKIWKSFDASDRTHCTSELTMGGESSYTELFTCLEMARDVRKLHEETAVARAAHATGQAAQTVGQR